MKVNTKTVHQQNRWFKHEMPADRGCGGILWRLARYLAAGLVKYRAAFYRLIRLVALRALAIHNPMRQRRRAIVSARGLNVEGLERRDLLSAPELTAFTRLKPAGSPTSADVLSFGAEFNKAVTSVDAADFAADGTTAVVTDVVPFFDSVPNGPSIVSVELGDNRLFMQKREPDGSLSPRQAVVARGVSWAPTSRGTTETVILYRFRHDCVIPCSVNMRIVKLHKLL